MATVKVSQATIDKIKKMGMTAALKKAPNASPEMKEALKRMYGAKRVAAAGGAKSTPVKSTSADVARGATKASKPMAKSADAARLSVTKASVKVPGKGPAVKTGSTTSNPVTAVFNKVSPYGNKEQKYVSGLPKEGLAGRKSVAGKPSVGEQISGLFSGKNTSLRANNGMTAAQVAAENKRRAAAVAAAKAKKK